MNREVAKRALDFLMEEPERLDMRVGVISAAEVNFQELINRNYGGEQGRPLPNPPCGTVCCFAGAIFLTAPVETDSHRKWERTKRLGWPIVREFAENELKSRNSDNIFYWTLWPTQDQEAYQKATNQQERVAVLKNVLNRYLTAEGQEPL